MDKIKQTYADLQSFYEDPETFDKVYPSNEAKRKFLETSLQVYQKEMARIMLHLAYYNDMCLFSDSLPITINLYKSLGL